MAQRQNTTTTDEPTDTTTLRGNEHLSAEALRGMAAEELRDAARYVEQARDDSARDAAGAARSLIHDAQAAEDEEGR